MFTVADMLSDHDPRIHPSPAGSSKTGPLGDDVAIIGVRFIDADGRAVTGPAPTAITLVDFTNSVTKGDPQMNLFRRHVIRS